MLHFMQRITRRRNEDGASAVEYGLLVAAIAAIIVIIVFALGRLVRDGFQDTCETMANEDADTATVAADCTRNSAPGRLVTTAP